MMKADGILGCWWNGSWY